MTRKQDETKDDHVFILLFFFFFLFFFFRSHPVLLEKCSFCTVQNCIVCALVCNLMYTKMYCTIRFLYQLLSIEQHQQRWWRRREKKQNMHRVCCWKCCLIAKNENEQINNDRTHTCTAFYFIWMQSNATHNDASNHHHRHHSRRHQNRDSHRSVRERGCLKEWAVVVGDAADAAAAVHTTSREPSNEMMCTRAPHNYFIQFSLNIWECVCDKINQEMKCNKYIYGKWVETEIELNEWAMW